MTDSYTLTHFSFKTSCPIGKMPCWISFSHIPTHARSSDPYVSSLSEKSVPHRYPCEISVTNTKLATRGRLLMWDYIFGAWLYSFENESWTVVSQEKTYLTCCVGHWVTESTGTGSPDDVKTHHKHTFSSTKLLIRVTVADNLVLVNPFWWNKHLFIV